MQLRIRPIHKPKPKIRVLKPSVKKLLEPDGRNILIVGKKTGQDAEERMRSWLASAPGYLEGYAKDEHEEPIDLYDYQINIMNDPSYFIHGDKARQIGWSYGNAAEAIAKSQLQKLYTAIFISINQEEASEKAVFARAIHDSLPLDVKKKCVVDNKKSLEFEDANGARSSRTRLISHAQREPRGKGGNTDVFLDESAHYMWGERIYIAAVPIITHGEGRLVTGSTPLGKRGIHYMLKNEPIYRRIYRYYEIYWWNCPTLIKEGMFNEAQKKAPLFSTEERVLKYGNDKLVAIFISLPLDSFQQEYELLTVDETVSYFPLDLIHTCCYEVPIDSIFEEEDDVSDKIKDMFQIDKTYPKVKFKLYESIEALAIAVQKGEVSPSLFAGYDVGRVKHNAELAIMEETSDNLHIVRYLESFPKVEYSKQEAFLGTILTMFPRAKAAIDVGGIGATIGENLYKRFYSRVSQVAFSNQWKEELTSDLHIRFEGQMIAVPYKKGVIDQIHSIKRKVTEHGHFKFDAEKNPNHHGDIFWAITLASSLGSKPAKVRFSGIILPKTTGQRTTTISHNRIINPNKRRNFIPAVFNLPKINRELLLPGVRHGIHEN